VNVVDALEPSPSQEVYRRREQPVLPYSPCESGRLEFAEVGTRLSQSRAAGGCPSGQIRNGRREKVARFGNGDWHELVAADQWRWLARRNKKHLLADAPECPDLAPEEYVSLSWKFWNQIA